MSLLVIDGNNVMGARPSTRWWRDRTGAAAALRDELEAHGLQAAGSGGRVVLVFDGRPPTGDPAAGSIDVRFAGLENRSADDAIVALVEEAQDDAVTVVTSDRGLAERVVLLGARVEGAGSFLRRVALAS